jgi:hypothetical protein
VLQRPRCCWLSTFVPLTPHALCGKTSLAATELPSKLAEKIKRAKVSSKIRTLRELNIDFLGAQWSSEP